MKIVTTTLIIIALATLSCKKRQPSPNDNTNTRQASNSQYDSANLTLTTGVHFFRDNAGADSIVYNISALGWFFWQDTNIPLSVWVNDKKLSLRYYTGSGYAYNFDGFINSGEMQTYDTARWKVAAPNGYTDIDYTTAPLPFYGDTIPYHVSTGNGIDINTSFSPTSAIDRIELVVSGEFEFDTVVSANTSHVFLSQAQLSSAFLHPNDTGYIYVNCSKAYVQTINNKTFRIRNYTYARYDVVVSP